MSAEISSKPSYLNTNCHDSGAGHDPSKTQSLTQPLRPTLQAEHPHLTMHHLAPSYPCPPSPQLRDERRKLLQLIQTCYVSRYQGLVHVLRSNTLFLPSYCCTEHYTPCFLFLGECSKNLKIIMTEEKKTFSSSLESHLGKGCLHGYRLNTDAARMLQRSSSHFFPLVLAARLKRCFYLTETQWPEPTMS